MQRPRVWGLTRSAAIVILCLQQPSTGQQAAGWGLT